MDACYRLGRGVAIRGERFGGLVYRHDNRRLYFLHSAELVALVGALDGTQPLGEMLDGFLLANGLPETARETFVQALRQLEKLKVLDVVESAAE